MILIAENDIHMCRFYNDVFRHLNIDFAMDGHELIAKSLAKPYALLWVDIVMPHMSGSQAVRQIRTTPGPNQFTCIAAVTGLAIEDISKDELFGFDWAYRKPVLYETMRQIFTDACEVTLT